MRSMRVDCAPVRIATRAELDRYMDGSGASVGRVMAAILGARHEAETFGRLGVAFQLTNFVRDVRVDYELERIYLPAEELERFGVDASALGLVSATPQLRALLSVEVGRARALFGETAAAVAAALPRHGAVCALRVPPTSPSSTASRRPTTTSSRTRSAPARGGSRGPCLHDQRSEHDEHAAGTVG